MNTLKTIALILMVTLGLKAEAQKKYDFGTDSVRCVENLSLFNEFIKQKSYADAYKSWQVCVNICPASRKGLYLSGVNMFRSLIKNEADEARKAILTDSLMTLFDIRAANFGQEGYVLGRKGVEMFKYYDDPCTAKDVLKRSIDISQNKAEAAIISTYYQALYKCYRNDQVDLETMFTEYLTLSDIINVNIERLDEAAEEEDEDDGKEGHKEKYVTAKNNLDEFFVQFADCEDIERIFKVRMDAAPNDLELKKKALRIMNRKDCSDSDLFLPVAKAIHDAEPSAESAYAIAQKEAKLKNYSQAAKYYDEASDLCGDCAEKVNYLIKTGYFSLANGNVSKVRTCANEILQREPSNGNGYILKGDAIFQSASSCDDGKLGKYGMYWLAYDIYSRAKAVDNNKKVQEIASKKLANCTAQFPTTEDAFFFGVKDGASYTTCTGEATTVKVR
ncbi:MAG: hypothetical protein O2867_00765 [Bacteroidetes bacterium]|nr:hypothetical protein [Bacteroidota bacterium]